MPRRILTMSIVVFCFIGSFAINLNPVDLYTMVGFGILGWGMQKYGFSQAALCIALILGPLAEANLRRGLLQSGDDVIAFVSGPITLLFLGLSIVSLALPFIQARRAAKSAAI